MFVLIITFAAVAVVLAVQIYCFSYTRREIRALENFFPDDESLTIVETGVTTSDLSNRDTLRAIASNPEGHSPDMADDARDVTLLSVPQCSADFLDVMRQTNEYLCKNAGTSADLGVLQDICDRKLDVRENAIRTTLNLPLLIGLGGTFIGIIFGVLGFSFDLDTLFSTTGPTDGTHVPTDGTSGLQSLLWGVGAAMAASFCGLIFTVINTAYSFKRASAGVDDSKARYFDFLRRELMPTLANSMTSSLNSLKGVLGNFIGKFGRNLNDYADTAELLNQNLDKQQVVLSQIQEMGMTKMARSIASAFVNLNESSLAIDKFDTYQRRLNATIQQVDRGVGRIEELISKFDAFITVLSSVAESQQTAIELQRSFKEAIETHFPTGSEARSVWRQHYDNLQTDAAEVTNRLNDQLSQMTRYVKAFVDNNSEFFDGISQLQAAVGALAEYSRLQGECYSGLTAEMAEMRADAIRSQQANAELHRAMLDAVRTMTQTVKELKEQ